MAKLGDYISIKHGYAFKGEYITSEDNGVVLVTPGNFKIGGGFKENKCKFFSSDYPPDYVLKANDLIVTMTDLSKMGDTLGYSAKVPCTDKTYLHNQRIGLVEITDKSLDKDYLYWFMRTNVYQKKIVSTSSGSTVKHTSPSRIYDVEINLPPINVQKKIAGCLNGIENKININDKINQNLEQQMDAFFDDFFIKKADPTWKLGTITDLGNVVGGGTPSKKRDDYYTDQGIAWVTPKDMSLDRSKFFYHGGTDITSLGLSQSSAALMPVGTVLFSSRAPIGYIAIAANEICTNQGFKSVVPHKNIGTAYVYCFLKANLQMIENMASGSTFKEVSGSTMKAIPAVVPDNKSLETFNEFADPLFQQQQILESENRRLADIRDSLLPQLMSGKLDVSGLDI